MRPPPTVAPEDSWEGELGQTLHSPCSGEAVELKAKQRTKEGVEAWCCVAHRTHVVATGILHREEDFSCLTESWDPMSSTGPQGAWHTFPQISRSAYNLEAGRAWGLKPRADIKSTCGAFFGKGSRGCLEQSKQTLQKQPPSRTAVLRSAGTLSRPPSALKAG